MKYNKTLLLHKIELACGVNFDTSPDIANAMDLFKKIKKWQIG